MLSSQGKNAPSNPYPHYLVRLATSRFLHWKVLRRIPFNQKSVLINRGRKRHINIWHINNFSVTPVTDPPGREPDSSRPGTRTKTFMFLGFRTQHINFWPLATDRETPPPTGRETPPHPGSHRKILFMFMCLFLSWKSWASLESAVSTPSGIWEAGWILFREYCFGGENSLSSDNPYPLN